MPNRLAHESSPYLLQHANNPVDWYPWGEEALQRSRDEDKPVFLSIGYSACHWCHVMEHESFESAEIAGQLNENFVCIKVDREERPDLDQIYMQCVQVMTGRGGWPMSVFLTPDLQPFFGGTYWPAKRKHGLPGFDEVLNAVLDAWTNRREQAIAQAGALTEKIQQNVGAVDDLTGATEVTAFDIELLDKAARGIRSQFDPQNGGFGDAPKFPQSMAIQFLFRMWQRDPERNADLLETARTTLDRMAAGGIYDHLAGGFARYSVDARWLVPHFEKMLYDNALLTDAYVDAYLATSDVRYGMVADEVCDYILSYMTDDEGGFHSTEDADSEGVEGKFYVWTVAEVMDVLGPELGEKFCYVFDISESGNFEGQNIPNLPKPLQQCAELKDWDQYRLQSEMATAKEKLLKVRNRRVRPAKDDKVLASWNGLMIHSMARTGAVLGDEQFLNAAAKAADFVLQSMRRDDGRLYHTWRHGKATLCAYLDDYTHVANGLVTLYESTFAERWIDEAVSLAEIMLQHFADRDSTGTVAGFFYTADDHETLIARPKDLQDNSIPSGNAMAATMLLRLGALCNRDDFVEAARATLQLARPLMEEHPLAVSQALLAADFAVGPVRQCVIAESSNQYADALRRSYLPRVVIAAPGETKHLQSLVGGKTAHENGARLFVCEDFACQQPISEEQIAQAIEDLPKSKAT